MTYFIVSRNFLLLSISSGILLRIFFKFDDLRLSSRKGSSVLAILNSTKGKTSVFIKTLLQHCNFNLFADGLE